MRTLDLTVEDAIFEDLDSISRAAGLTPAEFARRATTAALEAFKARDAARRDEAGYRDHPIGEDEFRLHPDDLKRWEDAAW